MIREAADAGSLSAPTEALLERLSRPYDAPRAVAALLGSAPRAARQIVGTVVATSREAEHLLEQMPHIVRSLAIATTDRPIRCYGELRGPVLWSETMSARSASAGDPGLYVCATTTKAYDTDENRVLTAALAAIRRAGRDADTYAEEGDEAARRARANGARAARFLEHQALAAVPVTRISGRSARRTRAGSRRATYRPALEVLHRASDPLDSRLLDALADQQTRSDHALLAAALDATEAALGSLSPLRTTRGAVEAGPVRYRHHALATTDEAAGVTVADQPVRREEDVTSALKRL